MHQAPGDPPDWPLGPEEVPYRRGSRPTRTEPGQRPRPTLRRALLLSAASTLIPGSGHLALRRPAGAFLVGAFVFTLLAGGVFVTTSSREELLRLALSPPLLLLVSIGSVVAGTVWILVVLRTFALSRPPHRLGVGQRLAALSVLLTLCLTIAVPFGFVAITAQQQRALLGELFDRSNRLNAALGPRVNLFLVGSDAGPDRKGVRTDTMMVASIDTRSGSTVLFGLPRNLARTPFPPGSIMARRFPNGFHDPDDPLSGEYLLNAVYGYGTRHPEVAPRWHSDDPGMNLLATSVSYMLGIDLHYYVQIDMQGFASLIDALGGVVVDVGPEPIPIGGIGPHGEDLKPLGYIPPGRQHLDGEHALWFARSRKGSDDYARMQRQRCLIVRVLEQKSPFDVLRNFQKVAAVMRDNIATNIPQDLLPMLAELAARISPQTVRTISFDPGLPMPNGGHFNPGKPDFRYMRKVVREAIGSTSPPATPERSSTTVRTDEPIVTRDTTSAARSRGSSSVTNTPNPTPRARAAASPEPVHC
ncbi:MAG TPA: LCP family protein [Pseudonocardiaceae bacterium]